MYVCTSMCAYVRPISYVLIQDFARYYLFLAYNEQNRYVCMWLLGEGCMYIYVCMYVCICRRIFVPREVCYTGTVFITAIVSYDGHRGYAIRMLWGQMRRHFSRHYPTTIVAKHVRR